MGDFLSKLFAASNPLWYYWPLGLVVAIVYKTTQYDDPKSIARGVGHFLVSVTAFMIVLAVVLYALSEWL